MEKYNINFIFGDEDLNNIFIRLLINEINSGDVNLDE